MVMVSIIMNCFNGEQYLKESIDSIYNQTYKDWEIIFWDNASTDGSAEVANSYDDKLKYFKGEVNVPLGAARKLAVSRAQGEWLAFLDVDDYWFKEKLAIQLEAVANTEYILCYAGIHEIHPNGKLIRELMPAYKSGNQLEQQLLQFDINMVTPIIKKSALDRFKVNFNEDIYSSEEYNLFMRLAAKGDFCSVHKVLGVWRISPGSFTDQLAEKNGPDRELTLKQLKEENPGIENQFSIAFKEAYSRGKYYYARSHVMNGNHFYAIKLMKSISKVSIYYKLLYYSLFVPFLWNVIHTNFVKRKILPLIWSR
jgi:glycosyltransferase involved in cell wall biosynthesis